MDQSHYRALLEEVRSDVADAERTIADAERAIGELTKLEDYLLRKVEGSGAAPRGANSKPAPARTSSRSGKPSRDDDSNAGDSGVKGMQTVEFGPDGFPST